MRNADSQANAIVLNDDIYQSNLDELPDFVV